ncbi:MAG: glycosyltransferase, partial [Cephaloticoccus sp.]
IGTMRTGKALPWLFRRSLRRAHHIVANSRAARATLQAAYAVPGECVSVIPNSLAFPPTDAARDRSLRHAHGANATTTVLLDVAMFRPEKNQRELITIAAGLPADFRWQLWLAGDGPELDPCRRYARELGLAERVKFPGVGADPSALYAAADLAVHASASEALSNFLIEAQAYGLPAVAYEAQGNEETMLPGETGALIPRGDQTGFRAAITHYAAAGPAIRQRARDFARRTFAPEVQVQAYLDLFARLVTLPS